MNQRSADVSARANENNEMKGLKVNMLWWSVE